MRNFLLNILILLSLNSFADIKDDLMNYGLKMPDDFHVVFLHINMSSKSNGSVIYTIYQNIQEKSKTKEVVFIFKMEGYSNKYFSRYMREICRVNPFPSKTAKICVNDDIYNKYKRNGWYSEYLYYSSGNVLYQCSAKFIDLNKVVSLPKTTVKVLFKGKILLDSTLLHTRRDLFVKFNNSIAQLSDNNYRLCLIDTSGNTIECVKIPEIENSLSIFKTHFNPDEEAIKIAAEYINEYRKINRPEISPETIFCTDRFIYVPISIAVFEKRKTTRSYSGGGNFKKKFKKGIIDDNLYGFIYKFDSNLNRVSTINLSNPLFEIYQNNDLSYQDIYSNDDTLFYVFHEYDESFKKKWYSKKVVSVFKMNPSTNQLEYQKTLNIPVDYITNYLNIAHTVTPFNGDLILSRAGNLYSLNQERKVAELSGLKTNISKTETYPKYINDTVDYNLKYEVLATNNLSNKYYCVLYKNFKSVILEVFDSSFKSIQVTRIGISDDNQVGGYFKFNNEFVQLKFSNGYCYLLRFALREIEN